MSDLKFTSSQMDNKLAEEYLKKHSYQFHSIGYIDSDKYETDNYNNKIYLSKTPKESTKTNECRNTVRQKLDELASKVEENSKLFGQLDNLIRETPSKEIVNCDIKLIAQNLRNVCYNDCPQYIAQSSLHMTGDVVLAHLGLVAQILLQSADGTCCIYADKNCFVISHLFVTLCNDVGLNFISLCFSNSLHDAVIPSTNVCYGVVSENSDVASSVDAFISATNRKPWKLTRILVQESVYEKFRRTLAWKRDQRCSKIDDSSCYEFSSKSFFFDYRGSWENLLSTSKHAVFVEAYRTNKELLSLINNEIPYCLSVWCQNILEANEIAFCSKVNLVWLNCFLIFDGSFQTSQSYYHSQQCQTTVLVNDENLKTLSELHDNWKKKSAVEQKIAVSKAIEELTIGVTNDALKTKTTDAKCKIYTGPSTFAKVVDSKICIGEEVAHSTIVCITINLSDILDFLHTVANGNSAIYKCEGMTEDITTILKNNEIPLILSEPGSRYTKVFEARSAFATKVVYSAFGTIFAN